MGVDETALSAEMGLYRDFSVRAGVPYGCLGLETFNATMWRKGFHYTFSIRDGQKAEPLCPVNKLVGPGDALPLHKIVEDFANNQQHFIDSFVPALEKMLSNGYDEADLVNGPDTSTDIQCPRVDPKYYHKFWSCFSTRGFSEPFLIISSLNKTHPRVLQVNTKTRAPEMWAKLGTSNQLWRWTSDQTQLINGFSHEPLTVAGEGMWVMSGSFLEVQHSPSKLVLDRGWDQSNGTQVIVFPVHGAINQKWTLSSAS